MSKIYFICLFLFLLLFTLPVKSSNSGKFDVITTPVFTQINQQLYNTKLTTRAIAQDHQGYLWIGTTEGLYQFDGYQMNLFRHQSDNKNSILDNHIEDIVVDRQGYLWLATRYNGLSRYDPNNKHFVHFSVTSKKKKGLSSNTIYEIKQDDNGLWVGTDNGLNFIDFDNLNITHYLIEDEPIQVISLAIDQEAGLWLGTSKGLMFRDKKSTNISHISKTPDGFFPAMTIKEILVAEDKTLWFGTSFDGHWRYFPETGKLAPLPNKVTESKTDGNTILQANSKQIWFGTTSQGIEIRDAISGKILQHIEHDSAIPHSLLSGGVSTLFKDKSGLIWVGNRHAGIQYLNPANDAFSVASSSSKKSNGLSGSPIDAILALADGRLLLSIASNYNVDLIDQEKGRTKSLKFMVNFEGKPRQLNVLTMLESKTKQIWLGSFPAYLSRYDTVTEKITNFKVPLKKQRQGAVLGMVEDQATGHLWLAMSEGMLRFDPNDNTFHTVDYDFHGALRLIQQDKAGNIWAGNKHGLYVLRKDDQKWFEFNQKSHPSFTNNNVQGILIDSHERVWIGSQNNFYQLRYWFEENATFSSVNSRLGRIDAGAKNIIEDNLGNIWLSLDRYFNPKTWTYHKLSKIEKANIDAFRGSYQKSNSGILLFGGANGLLQIDPENIQKWQYTPPLAFTKVTIDQQQIPTRQSITLPSDAKSLSVNFTAIDFTEPNKLSYRYKLEGFDEKWIATNAQQRVATYTSLAPGDYSLKISAKNRANIWSPHPLTLKITVEANYYQTWWFKVLALLIAGIIIYSYIKWRVKKIAHQEHIKNEMLLASERAEMMANLVEKKNQLLADVSHELRTPLTILQLKVEALQNNLVQDVEASYDGLMDKISDINHLISDIYQLAQSDIGALRLSFDVYNCRSIIDSWTDEFSATVSNNGFVWQQNIKVFDDISIEFDKNKIKQVLTNLIDNSMAYTDQPGKIRLTAQLNKNNLDLIIEDSAPGISQQDKQRIFERLYRIESSRSRATGGSGLGLAICKSIVEAHQGSIAASNSIFGGVAIHIQLPIVVE